MAEFRYAQFCPLARAAEILGERWTLLILRELFCGPQRFVDLRRRLPGVSSSVLTERLQRLEQRGIARRRELEPPAAGQVYELDAAGRALEEPVFALMRWGVRWLAPEPGDHFEPDWAALGLRVFARRGPTPARAYELRIGDGDATPGAGRPVCVFVRGGSDGVRVGRDPIPVDVRVSGPPLLLMGVATGQMPARDLLAAGGLHAEGDASALDDFAGLFDFGLESNDPPESAPGGSEVGPPEPANDTTPDPPAGSPTTDP